MEQKQVDFKYVQQHLANERTFLAWIRTAITIIGLGFLAAGVVFRTTALVHFEHIIAAFVGIGAVVIGCAVIYMATMDYKKKQRAINEEAFRSPTNIILFIALGVGVVCLFLMVLAILLLLY